MANFKRSDPFRGPNDDVMPLIFLKAKGMPKSLHIPIKAILIILLIIVAVGSLIGCASTPEVEERKEMKPMSRQMGRLPHEPGSLWSEDSRWNSMFSVASMRVVGDNITVKLSDRLRAQLLEQADKELSEKVAKLKQEKATEKAKDPKAATSPDGKDKPEGEKADTKEITVTIKEVLPKGVFIVTTKQSVVLGSQPAYVSLDGLVKEKDITNDDTVSSDSVFNLAYNAQKDRGEFEKEVVKAEPKADEESGEKR